MAGTDNLGLGDSSGGPSAGNRFKGWMDEVLLWDEAKDITYARSRAVSSQDYTSDPMSNPSIIDGSPAYGEATHDVGTYASGNVFDGRSDTQYASATLGTATFLTFDFGETVQIGSFGHHNRANNALDAIASSTLTFSQNATFGDGDDRVVVITHTRQQSTVPPDPTLPGRDSQILEAVAMENDDIALLGGVAGPFTTTWMLMGYEHICFALYDDPSLITECCRIANE